MKSAAVADRAGVSIRAPRGSDVDPCARICYDAFCGINARHGFPPDFPNLEVAVGFMQLLTGAPYIEGFIAEAAEGEVVGSAFLWDGVIAGVGPVTVKPTSQARSVGRSMMESLVERAKSRNHVGIRLVQAGFNMASLSLYTKVGFELREPLACINGRPLKMKIPGHDVRQAVARDIPQCDALCTQIHGHHRALELPPAVEQGTAKVVVRDGSVVGYTTDLGFFGHTVAIDNVALKALIAAADPITGSGLLLPMRNTDVLRWCLGQGLRITQPANLMSIGLYQEPKGAWLPSILY